MTGAAAWIAVTASGHGLGLYDVTPLGTIAGALLCAGAALLPDADHRSATISHSVPVLGKVVTSVISEASGGHRHGLHGLLAILCAFLLATGLSTLTFHPSWWHQDIPFGSAIMSAVVMTFAVKALELSRRSWGLAWGIGIIIAAALALYAPEQQGWFVVCVTVGYAVHLLGDFLTTGGLPLFWPWTPKPPEAWSRIPILNSIWSPGGYLALPLLGNSGSTREWLLLIPISLYALYGIVYPSLALTGVNLSEVISILGI